MQQYSVIAVQDAARKERLARLCGNQEQIRQCPVFLAFCADLHRLRLICEGEGTQIQTRYVEAFLTAVVDAVLVAQNVALAAESMGLGIVYIGALRNHPAEIVVELALPDLVFAVTGMCLGYPEEDPALKPRIPLPAVLFREQYSDDEVRTHLDAYDVQIKGLQMFRRAETGEVYGWMARAARRMAYTDPKQLRVAVGQVLRSQGFLLE
jgi:FMN reductase (NADPH)